ncbi:MAG: outer membrane beta-barrel protein [Melioribacteraceae bacterium]
MKKILSLIVLGLLLFSGISFAQDQSTTETSDKKKPNFWFGPKVGVDLYTPTIDQKAITDQLKSNFQAGVFFQFGRKLYFQPEFYYGSLKENSGAVINTLKVPMMIGLRLINLKIISAHIMGGPTASFLIKESVTNPGRDKSSFMLQAGAGVDLLGFITLDVRYSVDMNDAMKAQIERLTWGSGVNVTLGLKFR